MKRRYWITSIFIVFALVGQTICYAVILKPVDGTEFNSESDFPIQFRWKEDPEPKHLKVWRFADNKDFIYDVSGDEYLCDANDLKKNGTYRWGVTHTREELPTAFNTFTVAIPPESTFEDGNKDTTQGGAGQQRGTLEESEINTIVKKNNLGVESENGSRRSLFWWILFPLVSIMSLIVIAYVFFWPKLKLRLYTDDESYYWEPRKRKELLASPNNYVEDRVIMNLRRSVKSIQEEFQDMQRAVKISTTHAKIDHQKLKDEVRRIREIIQGGIEDYVSASQFKSKTESLETLLSQSIERLREDSHREMEQLNEKIASQENDLITLRQERLAEKNAAVVAARKELDILIEQVTTALPQDAANLLNALSLVSHADALPHLGEIGQRLLSKICSSKGSASLRAYIETTDNLQEIREKLDRLLTRTLPDADQRSSRLLGKAQEILTAYTNTKGSGSFDSKLIEQTRRTLLKEIGMPYISIVMGRFQGNGDKAYSQLAETLQQLGLDLIDITIGQTRPDERLHDVQSAMPMDKYPSGTIANVVKMGYIERATGEISKAQVIVSQ